MSDHHHGAARTPKLDDNTKEQLTRTALRKNIENKDARESPVKMKKAEEATSKIKGDIKRTHNEFDNRQALRKANVKAGEFEPVHKELSHKSNDKHSSHKSDDKHRD